MIKEVRNCRLWPACWKASIHLPFNQWKETFLWTQPTSRQGINCFTLQKRKSNNNARKRNLDFAHWLAHTCKPYANATNFIHTFRVSILTTTSNTMNHLTWKNKSVPMPKKSVDFATNVNSTSVQTLTTIKNYKRMKLSRPERKKKGKEDSKWHNRESSWNGQRKISMLQPTESLMIKVIRRKSNWKKNKRKKEKPSKWPEKKIRKSIKSSKKLRKNKEKKDKRNWRKWTDNPGKEALKNAKNVPKLNKAKTKSLMNRSNPSKTSPNVQVHHTPKWTKLMTRSKLQREREDKKGEKKEDKKGETARKRLRKKSFKSKTMITSLIHSVMQWNKSSRNRKVKEAMRKAIERRRKRMMTSSLKKISIWTNIFFD